MQVHLKTRFLMRYYRKDSRKELRNIKHPIGITLIGFLLVAFLGMPIAAQAAIVQDGDLGTIGACLAQPDGSRVTLSCEEVIKCGRSGKSFAIKEWFERHPEQPRLVVVSAKPLPV